LVMSILNHKIAKGRDENSDSPQDWVRYHDQYKGASNDCG